MKTRGVREHLCRGVRFCWRQRTKKKFVSPPWHHCAPTLIRGGGAQCCQGGGHKTSQSLLILWCKLQGMKNIDGNIS